jgi:alkanesulfonate monooxygenase SsuD/methylene tetrahydromethanopterin reductase-like flavin-dependent oxidoreductase (luciferase family)
VEVGVVLPAVGAAVQGGRVTLQEAARHAEDVGLDSVWVGDHLATGAPSLDCAVALATVAAVTERVTVGASVFVPALRPLVWAAKQVASLEYLTPGRLVLGVGSGGGPSQWEAAGLPYDDRGPRTETALRLLPGLLAGRPTELADEPGRPVVELAPAVPMPPVWVGNASPVAIRRAGRLGDGWFPSLVSPDAVAAGATTVVELARAAARPAPTIAVGVAGALGTEPGTLRQEQMAASIAAGYERPLDEVADIPISGRPAQAAERLAAYRAAGAHHVVMGIAGGDWLRQCDLLAETRTLLRAG